MLRNTYPALLFHTSFHAPDHETDEDSLPAPCGQGRGSKGTGTTPGLYEQIRNSLGFFSIRHVPVGPIF